VLLSAAGSGCASNFESRQGRSGYAFRFARLLLSIRAGGSSFS
jgi:hypothetical protein